MPDVYREPIEGGEAPEGDESFLEPSAEKTERKPPLEEEILELEKRIEQKKQELEKVKKLEGAVKEIGKGPSVRAAPPVSREEELTEGEKLSVKKIKMLSKEKQLETLSEIAIWQGLAPAIKIARAINNAYILDEFHDTLIDKLYKELSSRGELKEG